MLIGNATDLTIQCLNTALSDKVDTTLPAILVRHMSTKLVDMSSTNPSNPASIMIIYFIHRICVFRLSISVLLYISF